MMHRHATYTYSHEYHSVYSFTREREGVQVEARQHSYQLQQRSSSLILN
jgi:hypothetical protein